MYLHLGQDFIVNTRDVIGVFDLDTATDAGQKAKITDEFLRHAQQEGAVVDVSGSMPKSFVLTDFPDDTVYITQILPPPSATARQSLIWGSKTAEKR